MATSIAWLLSWMFGLLFPLFAPWVIGRLVGESVEGRSRGLYGARVRTRVRKSATANTETLTSTCGLAQLHESYETVQRAEGPAVPSLYYFAAWTDSGSLLGCNHHHRTVISAANCVSEAGGYVVAAEKGKCRALNDGEEDLFRVAYYGLNATARRFVEFKPVRALKPSLN